MIQCAASNMPLRQTAEWPAITDCSPNDGNIWQRKIDHLSIEGGQGDDRTIARAARLFVREGEAMLTEALEAGLPASSAAETEPAVIFAARWANLFAGQLAEWPED